jgi:hypothetical protein
MPTPLMVNVNAGLAVIVNALAPELNTRPLTSVFDETETPVILEEANVAVSAGPLGGPPAVQFAGVFQSPVAGLASQVALPDTTLTVPVMPNEQCRWQKYEKVPATVKVCS